MKREPWAIGSAFAHGISIVNSIFCRHPEKDGWTEDDIESSDENTWLVAEQINSMCSRMMMEDAYDMIKMVQSMPTNRLCERINCIYHHPENPQTHTFMDMFEEKCGGCKHNKKCKKNDIDDHYQIPAN